MGYVRVVQINWGGGGFLSSIFVVVFVNGLGRKPVHTVTLLCRLVCPGVSLGTALLLYGALRIMYVYVCLCLKFVCVCVCVCVCAYAHVLLVPQLLFNSHTIAWFSYIMFMCVCTHIILRVYVSATKCVSVCS